MLSKLLLAFFLSASFRSPNIEPNKFDWEFVGGWKTPTSQREYMRERENGRHYYGIHVWSRYELKKCLLEIEDYKKTARNIDTQKIIVKIPKDAIVRIGTLGRTDRWQLYTQGIGAYLDYEGITASMETHFKGIDAYNIQFSKIVWESETRINCQLEPLLMYRKEKENRFWQAKLRVLFGVKKPPSEKN